jgi:non-ribosomal peptide synthetase component F
MVQHDSFVNAAFAWEKEYRLVEIEVNLLQMAGFSFDVFAGDIARAVLFGGKIVLCPTGALLDLEALYCLVKNHRVTLFESTPALIVPFMDYVYDQALSIDRLKLLILGSDICPVEDFNRLVSRFGSQMRIINSYGVTEATIDTSYYEEPLKNIPPVGNVPIGRPMPNMKFYILDPSANSQPIGIPGELSIGGCGVARGYLNKPELTSERFINYKLQNTNYNVQNYKTNGIHASMQYHSPSPPKPHTPKNPTPHLPDR